MDPQPDGETDALLVLQAGMQWPERRDHAEPGPYGPLGVIFVRQRVPEIDQQAITEILRNMPVKTGNHLGARLLIGTHDLPVVFWIQLTGEHGRLHQVTEEDGELAPLGVGRARPRGACQARRVRRWRHAGRWRGL